MIRVPDWVANPLGRYYLYFAHHQGTYIRLAYADDLHGPWRIYTPGTLKLAETVCAGHIASPDVHVDAGNHQIVMYFHGPVAGPRRDLQGQYSFRAVSTDGLRFDASDVELGPYYLRAFTYKGATYAVAKSVEADGGGVLLRSPDGIRPFEQGPNILPRQRHVAVSLAGNSLRIFYSRGGDAPERILMSVMALSGHWRLWQPGDPIDILSPVTSYEGSTLPIKPSNFGAIHTPARQLRDPAIFEEDGMQYLLYTVAGERGIGMAELQS